MEFKIFALALIFTAALAPEMIYSSYTNRPSFECPVDAFKCVLYQVTDQWKPLDEPILRKECAPGETCELLSLSTRGNNIRWLPGDIWMRAFRFEGWALYEDGQDPYPDISEPVEPGPDPEPEPVCTKVCRNRSIHGVCSGYRYICEPVA